MGIERLFKRYGWISIIPILIAIMFFIVTDPLLKFISAGLFAICIGLIVFLVKNNKEKPEVKPEEEPEPQQVVSNPRIEPDLGESFTIISNNKKVEIITEENYVPVMHMGKKTQQVIPPDMKENFEKIANEAIPHNIGQDEQFSFLLEKILTIIKETYYAHSVLFFWYNKRKEKLTLERYVSASNDISQRKYDLEDDILSKIVQKEEPELYTDLSAAAEADAIRYYKCIQGIKSFVGVPIYYGRNLAAIVALDSKENDAFGIETIYSLGRFVRVISIIIALFDEKYAESLAERKLSGILNLLNSEKFFESEDEMYQTLETSLKDFLLWDAFTFVYYRPAEQKFVASKVVNKTSLKYIHENVEVDLNGTLVGKSIVSGMPVKIDDTAQSNFTRYSKLEELSFDGSFLAIPLVYDGQNYGVLCFESLKKNAYTNADVQFMKSVIRILAFIVYSYSNQAILKKLISQDIDTNLLNRNSFLERLQSDLIKSKQVNVPGAVAVIYIDEFMEQESLFEGNPFPKVLKTIAAQINSEMTPTNLFARISERELAVFFFNASPKDVYLWAEKLRVKIARKPIAVVSKQTTFTVSIGVASTHNKEDVEEVMQNALLALKKAREKGGNTVRNIN